MKKMKFSTVIKSAATRKERQKLRFVFIFLCLVLCVFSVNSCSRKPSDPLAYKNSAFKSKISSVGFAVDFEAIVTAEAGENESDQKVIFEFISPQSLKGLEVRIEGGITEISLDGRKFADARLHEDKRGGLFCVIEMLLPNEPIISIKSVSGREGGLPDTEALTAVTTRYATVYIDPSSGLPIKASSPDDSKHLMISVIAEEG